jgi:hypothetical protein
MAAIEFTQFIPPRGRREQVFIDMPDAISAKAQEIIAAGYEFQCEVIAGNTCSFTITDDDADHDIEFCQNGSGVPAAIEKMITRFELHKTRKANSGLPDEEPCDEDEPAF